MNERIKELAEQAKVKVWHDGGGLLSDKAFEIVAELIVKECAEVIDEKISPPSHPMNSIGYRLKEHFGVRE